MWSLKPSLSLALLIILIDFKGTHTHQGEWWERTVIYQIYPRSFKDTNGDGIGDLNGIRQKLGYLKEIGVETIWVQPIYKSPMDDLGYDVSDFRQIEPMFGNITDVENLLTEVHSQGMKLLMDFVPNHVSNQHDWFKKSVNREEQYTDFFVWANSKGIDEITRKPIVPNNWLSFFGGSAWEWNDQRSQFYYHVGSKRMPDLNYRSPKLRQAVQDEMRFWLDLGIDGFRVDSVKYLLEANHLMDEPYKSPDLVGSNNFNHLRHIHVIQQQESCQLIHEWRMLLDDYSKKDKKVRVLFTESYSPPEDLVIYFGNETYPVSHFPFYFALANEFNLQYNARDFDRLVRSFHSVIPSWSVANWHVSNHDLPRFGTRLNSELIDAGNMIVLLLPGVPVVYYGDEIGMLNTPYRQDQIRDPHAVGGASIGHAGSRDGSRGPMQWDDTNNAGSVLKQILHATSNNNTWFHVRCNDLRTLRQENLELSKILSQSTTNLPLGGFTDNKLAWLPLNPDYWYKNVAQQSLDPNSHLNKFKRLMKLKKSPVIQEGKLETCSLNDWVYTFVRKLSNTELAMVIINFGSELESVCAQTCFQYLPSVMPVHTGSANSGFKTGDKFHLSNSNTDGPCSMLRPKAAAVLTIGIPSTSSSAISTVAYCVSVLLSVSLSLSRVSFIELLNEL